MKKCTVHAIIFILAILAAAIGGLTIGQYLMSPFRQHQADSAGWHQLLHDRLHITAEQDKRLEEIEKRYRQRRQQLEEQIRQANTELAEAIKADKSLSPRVQAATDKIHQAMGEMQKATLEHLFEMQPILTPEQNRELEQMITDALSDN